MKGYEPGRFPIHRRSVGESSHRRINQRRAVVRVLPVAARRTPLAQLRLQLKQVNGAQGYTRLWPATQRFLHDDRLFARATVQCRVEYHGLAYGTGTTERVQGQLVQHLARQWLRPEVAIFRVQHRHYCRIAQQHEVRAQRRVPAAKRVPPLLVGEYVSQSKLVMHVNAIQVLTQEARQQCLKKPVHIEQKTLQANRATLFIQREALGTEQ